MQEEGWGGGVMIVKAVATGRKVGGGRKTKEGDNCQHNKKYLEVNVERGGDGLVGRGVDKGGKRGDLRVLHQLRDEDVNRCRVAGYRRQRLDAGKDPKGVQLRRNRH